MIAAYGERDDLKFRRAAQAIIQEEEAKRHTVLARELRTVLAANGGIGSNDAPPMPDLPTDRDSSLPLARVSQADRYLGDLVLAEDTRDALERVVNEVRHWPTLDRAGLPRRNRILLSGPPGCGKTSAAAAIAHELSRPLVTARVEGLISSYLGETAANLANLFAFVSTGAYVLFLDEFDSLGKMREDTSDHGELRRVVNAVLQQIDAYSGPSLIIAATNHSHVLDSALWRRFDSVVELGLPTEGQVTELLTRRLLGNGLEHVASFVPHLAGLPHAATEFFADSAKRHALLEDRTQIKAADIEFAANEVTSRPWS
ncbi:AAA family ATPase [Microbacterium sp. NPDC089698]|uniref:AAA family ATPase n=1 Tax=Microbacterium sp. NPDC089698 TaxID=3364200 RepID=UPI0037F19B67